MGLDDNFEKAGDFLGNLPNDGLSFGAAEPVIMMWVKIIVFTAVTIFAALAFYKFYLQYNIQIRIVKTVGGKGIEIKSDRAKEVVDDQGKRKLQLFKMRNGKTPYTMPIPGSEYRYKKGKQDYYDLQLDDNGQLHPIEMLQLPEEEQLLLAAKPQERTAWARLERRATEDMYKQREKWKEFLPAAVMVIAFVMSFLILFFMFKEMGAGMSQIAGGFDAVAKACLS